MIDDTIIAAWGAGLATILALIKVWEITKDRQRVYIGHHFRDASRGNDIIVSNPSSTPLMVSFWKLELRKRRYLALKTIKTNMTDLDDCSFTVAGHASHTLHFSGADYFQWGHKLDGADWYIKLHVVGRRRPIVKKV